MADPYIGKKIGPYELRAMIGQGGMAIVYRAFQPSMNREVAIKIVSKLLSQDAFFRERFEREATLAARLEHSNIVPVFEHDTTEDGITYLAMRYIRGGSLAERMQQSPVSLMQISSWLGQIANALDYAHSQGVIHRDIKPANILLDDQKTAYLTDFGLARMADPTIEGRPTPAMTKSTAFIGTPAYMSPEQIEQKPLDNRSDLYSLGVVLYELTVGHAPFLSDSTFKIMQMHLTDPPLLPRKLRPDLSPRIETVLLKALEKKPERRYQSGAEMADEFSSAITLHVTSGGATASGLRGARTFGLGWQALLGGLALIVVLLLGAAGLLFKQASDTPPLPTPTATAGLAANHAPRPEVGSADSVTLNVAETLAAAAAFKGGFVGMVTCNLTSDYHASYAAAVKTRAVDLGLTIEFADSNNDATQQSAFIHGFIAKGAKAIVLCPLDQATVADALKDASAAGVFVVENGDLVPPYGAIISSSNDSIGTAAGQYAAKLINTEMNGKANIAVLDYPDVSDVVVRADAMRAAVLKGAPNATIIGSWKGGTDADGQKSMRAALQQHPEINFILSINDAGAFGAVKVLKDVGIKPNAMPIVSVDAVTDARAMIARGDYFRGSVETSPTLTGQLAINAIAKLAAGGIVPKKITLPLRVVTKANINDPVSVSG